MVPSGTRAGRQRISDLALLLVAVVLLALAVRVVLALDAPSGRIGGDPAVYDKIGVSLAGGEGWSRPLRRPLPGRAADRPTALHPPAWPALLGATYALTDHEDRLDEASVLARPPDVAAGRAALVTAGARWTAGRLVNALLGTAAVALIALIAIELWGAAVGLVAGAVAALYPSLAVLGVALLSEPLFVALELAAVYAVLRRRRPGGSWRWLVVAGGLCGLAILTRANGAVLLAPLCLAVWTVRPRLRPRALLAPAVVVAAAVATVLPWTLRNASVLHAPVPVATDLGQTLAGTYNPASAAEHYRWRNTRHLPPADAPALAHPEAQRSAALTRDGLRYVAAHPLAVVEASAYNTLRLLDADRVARTDLAGELRSRALARVSFAGFGVLALLALAGLFTRRTRAAPRWLWLVPVLLWAGTVPFAVNFDRFRAPLDPFLILLAALALTAGAERAARSWVRRIAGDPASWAGSDAVGPGRG
jgi:4-amino-4-deoxy-L-arabinose transferase-like glycosyltransferase